MASAKTHQKEPEPEYACPKCGAKDWKWKKDSKTVTSYSFACTGCGERPRINEKAVEERDGEGWLLALEEEIHGAVEALETLSDAHQQARVEGRTLSLMETFELRRAERQAYEAKEKYRSAAALASVMSASREGYLSVYLPELRWGVTITWGGYLKKKLDK